MENRRMYKRYDVQYKVSYVSEGNPDEKIETKSFNFSNSGIGIYIKNFIKSDKIKLTIRSPHKLKPITIPGKVVWQTGIPWNGADQAGIRFLPK